MTTAWRHIKAVPAGNDRFRLVTAFLEMPVGFQTFAAARIKGAPDPANLSESEAFTIGQKVEDWLKANK